MTDFDRLPPDQRAVLSLVLDRGKSYAEVAELLAISESTVRDRAHAALDALAHEATASASRAHGPSRPTRSGASRPAATGARGAGASAAGLAGTTRGSTSE